MCGIVGYIGNKKAAPILLRGLRSLEYRGYDSAGMALMEKGKINRFRSVGKVDNLARKHRFGNLSGKAGIAHTRWATHGEVSEKNAHPHVVGNGKLALVHNGIIENYSELKKKLGDIHLESETDSEVLAAWIEKNYKGDLTEAVKKSLPMVRGTYGILVVHSDEPKKIIAARLGSPLVIGIGKDEYFLASDVTPMLLYTKQVTYLDDGEIATVSEEGVQIVNLKDEIITKPITKIDWDKETAQKQGFKHFMLKEIFDQPKVFEDAIRGRVYIREGTAHLGGLNMTESEKRKIKRIEIIAEGTAFHAGLVAKYAFERLARLSVEVDLSSEFRYRDPVIDKNTLVFVVSQSGETLDTLMALREAKRRGAVVRSIVNVVGSTIARESGAGTYIHAGPELSVASTKAYTNMVAVLLLYALEFGRMHDVTLATGKRILLSLLEIPSKMQRILDESKKIEKIAKKFSNGKNFFFLGRGVNFPVALEGALKLKEVSYIHCEGFAGGQLKHGPLALVEEGTVVVGIMPKDQLYEKMKSNIAEVKARGAKVLLIVNEANKEIKDLADEIIVVPKTMELLQPLLTTIPLQLLAYYIADYLGRDVDRPRNLAKSVTVE